MKRSAEHFDQEQDNLKRVCFDIECDLPTTAVIIEKENELSSKNVDSILTISAESINTNSDPITVDSNLDPTVLQNDTDEQITNNEEPASSLPFVIVVNSERNFRVIRVYTCLQKAIVEQCVPLTFLARLSGTQIASPVTVFGDRNIASRIKKVVSNVSVSTVARYEDTDRAYIKYVLNKNTKMTNSDTDAVRIVNLKTSDGCAPLCATTATQLGLLTSDNRYYGHGVEPLVNNLCSGTGIKFAKEFLRDLLCDPPPQNIVKNIANVCAHLSKTSSALPTLAPKKNAEVYAQILRSSFSNFSDIRDILSMMSTVKQFLSNDTQKELVTLLQPVVNHFCMQSGDSDQTVMDFKESVLRFEEQLGSIVPPVLDCDSLSTKSSNSKVLYSCNNNELIDCLYFAQVERDVFWDQCEETKALHNQAKSLVEVWCESIEKIGNACLALRLDEHSGEAKLVLLKKEKPIAKSDAVFAGQKRYEQVVTEAIALCASIRHQLCSKLDMQVLQRTWYWLVILQALRSHVKFGLQKKWSLPTKSEVMRLSSMWPYWLKRTDASDYSIELKGTTVLTGANKSGKSVLLRTVCAVALLSNCGLMVPCENACVPQFDKIFLKTSSFDLPHENKSTFTVTTDDLASMSNTVTNKSLVLFDDFGDGTFAEDALFVAAGTLTFLNEKRTTSIIATHMRQVLDLLPDPQQFLWKTMKTIANGRRVGESIYSIDDGVCEYSMAFSLLLKAGVNRQMLRHIESFMKVNATTCDETNNVSEFEKISVINENRNDMLVTVFFHEIYCAESGKRDTRDFQRKRFADKHKYCLVRHTEQAPPSFTNSHFVYVRKNIKNNSFYVGETDNIQRRIEEHRKHNVDCRFEFHVVAVTNKSVALCAETETIRALIRRGFRLDSECDGNHRNGL